MQLIDPTTPPPARTRLLDAKGRTLRTVERFDKARVRMVRLSDGAVMCDTQVSSATMIAGPTADEPCPEPVDWGKPVTVTLQMHSPEWLARVARRR